MSQHEKPTDPTRTVKAALGLPDREHGWHCGPYFIPYLSFSQAEVDDLTELDVRWAEFVEAFNEGGGAMTLQAAQQIRELNQQRAATYARMFARRMGEEAPSAEEVYRNTHRDDLASWQARTARGGAENPPQAEARTRPVPTSA